MLRSRVHLAALPLLFAATAVLAPAQDLPVLTFTYETAQGVEEDDEEVLEPTYVRHTLITSDSATRRYAYVSSARAHKLEEWLTILLSDMNINPDTGVHIDIEGAEVNLLEALLDHPGILNRIEHIFAETHEKRIPGHKPRVEALRERAKRIERPKIDLDWQ